MTDPLSQPMIDPIATPSRLYPNFSEGSLEQVLKQSPATVQAAQVAAAARAQDLRTLMAASRIGLFDFETSLLTADDPFAVTRYNDDEVPIVAALTCVIQGATKAKVLRDQSGMVSVDKSCSNIDVNADLTVIDMNVGLDLDASDEFKAFFARECSAYVASFTAYRDRRENTTQLGNAMRIQEHWDTVCSRYGSTLAVLAAGACALDLPQTVQLLDEQPNMRCETCLKPSILGLAPDFEIAHSDRSKQGPLRLRYLALAYQFSAMGVLDLLEKTEPQSAMNLAQREAGEVLWQKDVSLIELMANRVLSTRPAVLDRVMAAYERDESSMLLYDGGEMVRLVENATKSKFGDLDAIQIGSGWLAPLIGHGFHRQDPESCALAAIRPLNIDYFELARGDVPWVLNQGMASSKHLVGICLKDLWMNPQDRNDQVLRLIEMVVEDGKLEEMLEPVHAIAHAAARAAAPGVLMKLLELGADLDAKDEKNESIEDVLVNAADKVRGAASVDTARLGAIEKCQSIMQSWRARQCAAAALAELEMENPERKPRASARP